MSHSTLKDMWVSLGPENKPMDMDYPDLCEWDRLQDQFTEKVKRILFDLKRIFG